jgi:hypothetical protein
VRGLCLEGVLQRASSRPWAAWLGHREIDGVESISRAE